jgi:protein-arginine kinase activator protein McsA
MFGEDLNSLLRPFMPEGNQTRWQLEDGATERERHQRRLRQKGNAMLCVEGNHFDTDVSKKRYACTRRRKTYKFSSSPINRRVHNGRVHNGRVHNQYRSGAKY